MKLAGIIAEYNPFHLGHKYQLEKARELGFTHIAVVMSGNIVQRGDIAILDAHTRAKAAVRNGADLVIELPPPYCAASAADFARAGVGILSGLSCVDSLVFGSESGSTDELIACADAVSSGSDEISKLMSAGYTYPQAVSKAYPQFSGVLSGANNTLAIEYINALKGTSITPAAIKRTVGHDSSGTVSRGTDENGKYASASFIRQMILQGKDVKCFVPFDVPKEDVSLLGLADSAILFKLCAMSKEEILSSPYVDDGIGSRLMSLAMTATSVSGLCGRIKTKNVTLARVRRAVLLAALGVKAEDLKKDVPYARVLAANERGFEILSECKKKSSIPISQSLARLGQTGPHAKSCAELTELASRLRYFARIEKNGGYVSEYSRQIEVEKFYPALSDEF